MRHVHMFTRTHAFTYMSGPGRRSTSAARSILSFANLQLIGARRLPHVRVLAHGALCTHIYRDRSIYICMGSRAGASTCMCWRGDIHASSRSAIDQEFHRPSVRFSSS